MIRIRGIGPVYWGVEQDEPGSKLITPFDPRRITSSWMIEDRPPWRKSIHAFRVRIRGVSLHLGLCKRLASDSPERPWRGQYHPVTEISKWRRIGYEAEVQNWSEDEDTGVEQVRPIEPG